MAAVCRFSSDWNGAFYIVRDLHRRANAVLSLPCVPVAAGLGNSAPVDLTLVRSDVFEELPVEPILSALDLLTRRPQGGAEDAAALAALADNYRRLAAL